MSRPLPSLSSFCCLLLALLLGVASNAWSLENQLRDNASPYLAMHGDDPVAWQEWSPSILELAQKENRLIFISSGYFSCRWCHVMQRESYSDPAIAALLNRYFIPVKVDRELNPALDAYLIDYMQRTRQRAGWPLNIFLTPEGYPLTGTTYLPPERFRKALIQLREAWAGQADRMRDLARRALLELTMEPPRPQPGREVSLPALRERLVHEALELGDSMEGGFGLQNRFPMAPQLRALLRIRGQRPREALDHLLTLTLDQMANQGLRDQLGGGFFRYAVDPSWHVPHFEKMLYTQALLARVYLLAGKLYQRQDYLDVARDTLDFVLREMRGPQGLFIASFSAVDEKGEEGAHYLWTPGELVSLLGEEDAGLARRRWAMLGTSPVDGGYLPRQGESAGEIAKALGGTVEQVQQRLESIRNRLLKARGARTLPADTKELAGWNGLLLGALALAGRELEEPRYLDEARRLARVIRRRLWHEGELWHAAQGGQRIGQSVLADYAYLAEGLKALADMDPGSGLRAWQQELVRSAWQKFHDPLGWRSLVKAPLPGMGSVRAMQDGALPAAPAWLMAASTGVEDGKTVQALQEALPRIAGDPFWYASYLVIE